GIVHFALLQANTLTVLEVDGGNQQHTGISSVGQSRKTGRRRSRLPADEICEKPKPCSGALFRVELGREDISPRYRTGKAQAVVGLGRCERAVGRHDEVAV